MRNFLPQCFGFADSKHKVSNAKQEQPSTLIEELCHRFSLAQLRKATNNFEESRIVGREGSAIVYKGCIVINNEAKEVAIKCLKDVRGSNNEDLFKNEIVLLCQLHHPNLVSLIGFCHEKNKIINVFEYMSNGALLEHLRTPTISWKKRLEICIGAARGLHYLHTGAKYTIIHRHVKSSNILLDENWVPKITDLELSLRGAIFTDKHPKPIETLICGTIGYLEPEYAASSKVTEKTDVYSFGMVLLDMACAERPWEMLGEMTLDDRNEEESEMTVDDRNKNESEMTVDDRNKDESEMTVDERNEDESEMTVDDRNKDESEKTVDDRNKDESEGECFDFSWTTECPDSIWTGTGERPDPMRTMVKKIKQKGHANEIIDPFLKGKIAPECWNLFIDIVDRCLLEERTERPAMGEVESELERALQLQEEADAKLTSGCEHSLVCTTSITFQPQQPKNEGVATHSEINPC